MNLRQRTWPEVVVNNAYLILALGCLTLATTLAIFGDFHVQVASDPTACSCGGSQ